MTEKTSSKAGITKNLDNILNDRAKKILEVRKIMKMREDARQKEDFHTSDVLREKLKGMGVIVLDQKNGPSGWKFANGQSKKLPSGISIPDESAKKRKRDPEQTATEGKKKKSGPKIKSADQSRNLAALQAVMGATEESNQNVVKGVRIEDIVEGRGRGASYGDKVKVHYIGRLQASSGKEGKIFDCSSKKPFSFRLGKGDVIQGWDIGVVGLQIGGKRKLTIPPERAYGRHGAPPKIPGNATLIFEVTLVDIK